MEPPVLLDENVEHEVLHRLRNYEHTVEHIDLHDHLQKGDEDRVLAQYSRSNQALIMTYDDDFETDYRNPTTGEYCSSSIATGQRSKSLMSYTGFWNCILQRSYKG